MTKQQKEAIKKYDIFRYCWALLVKLLLGLGDKQQLQELGNKVKIHVPLLGESLRADILKYLLLHRARK
jgi:hypothetical protein